MEEPSDCSWIWRRVLKLRGLAIQLLSYQIGNGLGIYIWFDPWWRKTCLVKTNRDLVIAQSGLDYGDTFNSLISSGQWNLPSPANVHHLSPTLEHLQQQFDYPMFNLHISDKIL